MKKNATPQPLEAESMAAKRLSYDPEQLLLPAEVAERLRVSAKTLEKWRVERRGHLDGTGLRFARMYGRVVYRRGDVEDFIAQRLAAFDAWQAS